ncbi:hypothetical protein FA15DRAFT_90483 [Coprinopsis marcescibilis]|uniref:Uncharacterized protein n=1 Tax=Coprinopsis marcescibilis TaxID=230819 RepID=A0A5C3L684_COPMA|nr:hypothetical protein FA15DRAFT_90483 [Coprinopsis marcescibilis]
MFDTAIGKPIQVAQHDAPVKCVAWVEGHSGFLATGSWDKTMKYWDIRTQRPVATIPLLERCYAFGSEYPWLVVGTAGQQVQVFDIKSPTVVFKQVNSRSKMTRAIHCFTDKPSRAPKDSYAVGGIDGIVSV